MVESNEKARTYPRARCALTFCLLLLAAGCSNPAASPGGSAGPPNDNQDAAPDNANESPANSNSGPSNEGDNAPAGTFLYLLQPEDVTPDQVAAASPAWIVIEPEGGWDDEGRISAEQLDQIRDDAPCGPPTILAYLSIGEAEDYRDYWDTDWVDGDEGPPVDGVAPAWLGPSNPDWPGNYKVRYWDPEWQAVILGTPDGPDATPLDRIIDAGFNGVYLDIVDAYEFWSTSDDGDELTREQARRRMIEWVIRIGDYARNDRGAEGFLVFPQNASDIIRDDDYELDDLTDDYLAAIDGIGIEDLYFDERSPQPAEETEYRMEQLVEYRAAGKTVLVTDYVVDDDVSPAASANRVQDFYEQALAEGFIPYAATEDRNLDEILTLDTPAWPVGQLTVVCP